MAEPVTTSSLTLQNFFSTTLSSSINGTTDTVIPLNAVPTGSEGFLVIDGDNSSKEVIYFTTKGGSSVTCPNFSTGRGLGGTTAVSHSSGATVKMNVVSEYFTELQNGNAISKVPMQVASNPYKFSVYRNSAWTDGSSAWAKVTCDTENFDTGSNFASGTFTAPIAGFYQFSAGVASSVTAGNFMGVALYKNGSAYKGGLAVSSQVTTGHFRTVSSLIQLAASDTVDVYSFGTGGAGTTGQTSTWFNGYLVSAT